MGELFGEVEMSELGDLVEHRGGCHCGAVTWTVLAPPSLTVVQCNCSICRMKQNHHFIVPRERFVLLTGGSLISTYTFNTHAAKHKFCSLCGVQSFYIPRSNQDGVGIMPHCVSSGTIRRINIVNFDGKDWENSFKSDSIIKSMSKCP